MNVPIIDIHPHVISADTQRYPRAPLGGHQSDWSRERPVGVEQLIAEQDRAGIRKAALVQASTCYGHDNSYVADAVEAHPDRFTGVFSCDILAADACETMAHWMDRGLTGLQALHDRQHDARSGGLAGRSAIVPRMAQGRGEPPSCLSADDGGGHSAGGERAPALSRVARGARSSGASGPGRRASLPGGRQSLAARPISRRLRQGHRTQLRGRDNGKGHAGNVLRTARVRVRRVTHCVGLELSGVGALVARSFSPWRRTRFTSCRRRTANGSSRARRRRCIQRWPIIHDSVPGFTRSRCTRCSGTTPQPRR